MFFNSIHLLEGEVQQAGMAESLMSLLPFILLIPIFYFLIIRPQKKQEKETAKMRSSLMIGDEVVTIGGVMGKIVKVKDDYVVIETGSDRVRIKFRKSAIGSVEKKSDEKGEQRATFKATPAKKENGPEIK